MTEGADMHCIRRSTASRMMPWMSEPLPSCVDHGLACKRGLAFFRGLDHAVAGIDDTGSTKGVSTPSHATSKPPEPQASKAPRVQAHGRPQVPAYDDAFAVMDRSGRLE